MFEGRVVRVTTTRMGGGEPMVQIFDVGIEDPNEAVEAVRTHIHALEGDHVEACETLPASAVAGLELKLGEVKERKLDRIQGS